MRAGPGLSLDHITVADTTPWQLAELAVETGCRAICPFLHSMPVLPAMPDYDLVRDAVARRTLRDTLSATGIGIDLVYPFTLAGRTQVEDFVPSLEVAAELGARQANILCYDREPRRRSEKLGQLAERAAGFGLTLSIEFYPPSQIRTLRQAIDEIECVGRTDIGVTLDILHLMRSGEGEADWGLLSHPYVGIAQICDGPAHMGPDWLEREAGSQRLLPGEGVFGIAAFVAALGSQVRLSVEVPQQTAIDAGRAPLARARAAVEAARATISS